MEALQEHDWPGNVRELQNTIERAVILSEDGQLIEAESLGLFGPVEVMEMKRVTRGPIPIDLAGDIGGGDRIVPIKEMERAAILRALRIAGGNRTRAAEELGLSLRTLRNRIREYREEGIAVPGASSGEANSL